MRGCWAGDQTSIIQYQAKPGALCHWQGCHRIVKMTPKLSFQGRKSTQCCFKRPIWARTEGGADLCAGCADCALWSGGTGCCSEGYCWGGLLDQPPGWLCVQLQGRALYSSLNWKRQAGIRGWRLDRKPSRISIASYKSPCATIATTGAATTTTTVSISHESFTVAVHWYQHHGSFLKLTKQCETRFYHKSCCHVYRTFAFHQNAIIKSTKTIQNNIFAKI